MDTAVAVPPAEVIVRTPTYAEAEAAVDRLSDAGFPVETTRIVWSRLRRIEHVTGRKTTLRAFVDGGVTGLWIGALFGLVLSLFVELDDNVGVTAMVLTYTLLTGLLVGGWRAVVHSMQRGRRDFGTIGTFEAEEYEVWVDADVADAARQALGLDDRGQRASPAAG